MSETTELNPLLQLIKAFQENPPEPGADWLAKRKLATELREMANIVCGSRASEAEILGIADAIRQQASVLRHPAAGDYGSDQGAGAVPGMETFIDRGPVAGLSNPVAPPASLGFDLERGCVVGEVEFGKAYEGAPGCAHGGFVAAVLDEALGNACVFGGGPAMTVELTTRYLSHTPIRKRLTVESRVESVDGKKIVTSGWIADGDKRLAEGSGLFIAVGAGKFEALRDARDG